MTKAAFDKIAEGLTEALTIARGEAKPLRLHVPPEIGVRDIRTRAGMSQDRFASAYGFTIHQIRQWEQGRSRPLGAMRAYLMLIDRDPRAVLEFLHGANAARPERGRSRPDADQPALAVAAASSAAHRCRSGMAAALPVQLGHCHPGCRAVIGRSRRAPSPRRNPGQQTSRTIVAE